MNKLLEIKKQLVRWFIEPATSIQETERRRQTQLLSSLLLTLVLVSILSVIFDVATGQLVLQELSSYIPIIGVVVLIAIYGLSRTRYYIASAVSFVGLLFIVVHIAPLLEADSPGWLYYAILPILLSGILFSLGVALVVAAASIGSMLLLIAFVPEIRFDLYWLPIMYITIITVVIVTFIRHRDLVESDRQIDLMRASAAVQESETKWRLLIQNVPAKIFHLDRDGVIEFTNRIEDEDDMVGKNIYDALPPDHHDITRKVINQVLENEKPGNYEIDQTTPAGTSVWYSILVSPIIRDGYVIHLIFITTDITAQKQAEIEHNRLQQEIIETQQRAITELSTPVIPVMKHIIVLPLIGSIDSMRAKDITRLLLAGISQYEAKVVILDVTGVGIMDTSVVNHLNKTIRAAQLKGAHTIVTGVSDVVAEAIVDLGIDWSDVATLSDLQMGLLAAMKRLGYDINKVGDGRYNASYSVGVS